MRYKITYIFFLIAVVLYANTRIGGLGVTPRHIMTIMMFAVCVYEDRGLFMDRYFGIYLLFVAGFGFSSAIFGYFPVFLIRDFIGFYFVAYVGYWATKILVHKYDGVQWLINTFIVMGMVDAVVTVGQLFNISIFQAIPDRIGIRLEADYVEAMEKGMDVMGLSLPGIMCNDVYNGYFLMVVSVLCLYYQKNRFNFIKLLPWMISMVALYGNQERGPLFIALAFSVFVLFKVIRSSKSQLKPLYLIMFVFISIFGVYVGLNFLLSGESRFAMGFDLTNRDSIYQHSIEYIRENFLWGGWYNLLFTRGFAPHNLFLNAWIYGGLVGFVAIVVLSFKQLIAVIRLIMSKLTPESMANIVIAMAFFAFALNSLLHNKSVVTGDAIIWILWGAVLVNGRNRQLVQLKEMS